MAKELLLYGELNSESTGEFIASIAALESDSEEIVARLNTPGGSPEYTFGAIAKFAEYPGPKKVKVDGKAYSMGLFFCCYTKDVTALDVTEFILHRAAYSSWLERDAEFFNDAVKANLTRINASLRKAFEATVNVPLFEQLTGCKLKDVFSLDSRIDVSFDAKIAKKVGLIKEIVPITPQKKAEIESFMIKEAAKNYDIAAYVPPLVEDNPITKSNNSNKMTTEEFKAKHADIYAEAVQAGVLQERDRVSSILVFNHLDAKACKEAIESGKPLSATQIAEFSLKALSPEALATAQKENAAAIKTGAAPTEEKATEEKALADFSAEVKSFFNSNK